MFLEMQTSIVTMEINIEVPLKKTAMTMRW